MKQPRNLQLMQRAKHQDTRLIPCGKALEMVTIEPARALGIDHLVGSLAVGKKADVIAIDAQQPHLAPFGPMPVQRLVYHAMGQDVNLVIVNGEIMMEGRTLTQIDEKQLIQDTKDVLAETLERAGHPQVCDNPHLYDLRQ